MCNLYSFRKSPVEARALFEYPEQPRFPPRQVVAPGEPVAVVRADATSRQFALVRWGFVPSWSKEMKPGKPLTNARTETVFEKPSFRHAIRRRRCLVPADGFYEWQGDAPGRKQAFRITRPDDALFAFAGIWEHWTSPDGSELETAAILTTRPNAMMARIHTRMPVVIRQGDFDRWLDHSSPDGRHVTDLMQPVEDAFFVANPTQLPRKRGNAQTPDRQTEAPAHQQLSLF